MSVTYRARLRDNIIEWVDDQPPQPAPGETSEVEVTILDHSRTQGDQGKRMAAALSKLASLNSQALPVDAAAWEREQRQDPTLPHRDDGC